MSENEVDKAYQTDEREEAGDDTLDDTPTENQPQQRPNEVHAPNAEPCNNPCNFQNRPDAERWVGRFLFPLIFFYCSHNV